jgi:hypothetical protein
MSHHHPDVHRPWSDWSESQTLHVAVAYSNPFRFRTRRELLNNFRRHMAQQPNVVLHVAELAYGDRPFEVTGEHPHDIQLRTGAELWHKENLLNIAVSRFPADWRYGAVIDGDFSFTRYDWALETVHQLQHHAFVQLYSSYSALSKDHRPHKLSPSFAYGFLNWRRGWRPKDRKVKDCYATPYWGATGGAWAFTRAAYNQVGGMLDTCILGSADWNMAYGLAGQRDSSLDKFRKACPVYVRTVEAWQQRAAQLSGNIGCLDCHAVHHFHGDYKLRGYGDRWKILTAQQFDPQMDIQRDWQGVWALSGNKPALRDDLRAYFQSRNEDDPNLMSSALI